MKAHLSSDQHVATTLELVWGQCRGAGALEAMRWRAEGCVGRDKAVCSVRCSILEDSWGGRMRPEWDRGNLIRMIELGDTGGWTCAEWEGRGLETG